MQGLWWVPGTSTPLSGTFSWHPNEGGELVLVGFIHEDDGGDPTTWSGPAIHGVAEREEYTLLGCHTNAFSIQYPGVPSQTIVPFGGVVAGAHLSNVDAPTFDRVVIELDYLADLSGRGGPSVDVTFGSEVADGVVARYELPRDVVASLADRDVRLTSSWATTQPAPGAITITEDVKFQVDTRAPLALRELLDGNVNQLRNLVVLAAHRSAAIRSVAVGGVETTETGADGREIKRTAAFLAQFLPQSSGEAPTSLRHPPAPRPQGPPRGTRTSDVRHALANCSSGSARDGRVRLCAQSDDPWR